MTPAGRSASRGSLTAQCVRCSVERIRTTFLATSNGLPHVCSAARMHDSASGSTMGIRPRRTPGGARRERVDVRRLPVDLLGDGDRDEVGEADAGHVAGRHRRQPEEHDHADPRRREVGEPVDPEAARDVRIEGGAGDVLAALLDDQHVDVRERERGDEIAASSVRATSAAPPTSSAVRAATRTTSPDGASIDATPPRIRPDTRSASMPSSSWSRITACPARVELSGTGLLAEADDSHLRATALDRSPEPGVRLHPVHGQDAIGGRGVDVEVQRAAGGIVGDDDRLHRRPDLGVERVHGHAELLERRQLALGRRASVAAHGRDDERGGAEIAEAGDGAAQQLDASREATTAGAHGNGHAVGDRARQAPHDLLASGRFDVADGRWRGHRELHLGQSGDRDGRVDGERDPGTQLVPPHMAMLRGSLASVAGDETFDGEICGFGTASGTRVVIGRWPISPFGSFADAMVEDVDGRRVLIAPDDAVATYVGSVYAFDDVVVAPVVVDRQPGALRFVAGPLVADVALGPRDALGWALRCVPRRVAISPQWATVVDPVARVLLRGVRTRGETPGGREFYAATDRHRVDAVAVSWDGVDRGALTDVDPPVRFGFSSTPRRPSLVAVATTVRRR